MTKKLGRPKGSKTNVDGVAKLKAAPKEELEALYAAGLTTREIGERYGASRTAVDNRFVALGIARRWHDETGKWKNAKMSVGLTSEQTQLLLGSCLGDACLYRQAYPRADGTVSYSHKVCFAHGEAQLAYLEHKRGVMLTGRENLPKTCVSKIGQRPEGSNLGRQMSQFSFTHTPTVKTLEVAYTMRHPETGKVYLSQAWADAIGPLGFAYWFLDDGHLRTKVTHGDSRLQLSTNAYDAAELGILLGVVRRFGGTSANINRAREGQFIIVVNPRAEVETLGRLIASNTPECMKHKLKDLK